MKKQIVIFIAILITIGLGLNLIPMSEYSFGTYLPKEYKDSNSNGIKFEYYGILAGNYNKSSNCTYMLGFTSNITKCNSNTYYAQSNLYKIISKDNIPSGFNGKLLPDVPFFGSSVKEVSNFSAKLNYNNQLINLLFPKNNDVNSIIGNFSIEKNYKNMFPEPYVGFPEYHFGKFNSYNSSAIIDYIHFGSEYHMVTLATPGRSKNAYRLFESIVPDYNYNNSQVDHSICLVIQLGAGNDAPAQNWSGWFLYGLSMYFPLNIILLIAAGIIAIYYYRKAP